MPAYTKSYSSFCQRLKEVESLQREAKSCVLELGSPRFEFSQTLCRSAIVLLCAHIESYFEEVIIEVLEKAVQQRLKKSLFGKAYMYKLSEDLVNSIMATDSPIKRADKLMQLYKRDEYLWSPSSTTFAEDADYEKLTKSFSTPTFKNIKSLLNTISYKAYPGDISSILKSEAAMCKQMVDSIVDKRNLVAHGDRRQVSITPLDIMVMVQGARKFCNASDKAIASWARGIGCPVR